MADLTQTAANVGLTDDSATTTTSLVQYGEAITQGQPIYLSSADSKYYRADADAAQLTAQATGIALTPGAADEYGIAVTAGAMDIGATLTVGETYVLSATVGAIAPIGDLTSGDYVTILGVAKETDTLVVDINATGTQTA